MTKNNFTTNCAWIQKTNLLHRTLMGRKTIKKQKLWLEIWLCESSCLKICKWECTINVNNALSVLHKKLQMNISENGLKSIAGHFTDIGRYQKMKTVPIFTLQNVCAGLEIQFYFCNKIFYV